MPPTSPPRRGLAAALALALALAAPAEGLRRTAYRDPPGILSICYGHTGEDVTTGQVRSLADCRALLSADMRTAIATVDHCRPGLPANVLAAFADATYNLGPAIACDPHTSQAAAYLAASDYHHACAQLTRWDKARIAGIFVTLPGLTRRRAAEKALCLTPDPTPA